MKSQYSVSLPESEELPTVAFFIPSLGTGGAERQLMKLVKGINKSKWNVLLLTMYDTQSPFLDFSQFQEVKFVCLRKDSNIVFLYRLCKILHKEKVTILHAFLSSAQYYSVLAKIIIWRVRIVFGIRDSLNIFYFKDIKNILINLVVFGFSFLVDKYIFNSYAGRKKKSSYFVSHKAKVIPNGIDAQRFCPSETRLSYFRQRFGWDVDVFVVGILANISHYKDYPTLIQAAKIVTDQYKHVQFVAIGEDRNNLGAKTKAMVNKLSLEDHFHFIGSCHDVENILPHLDLLCSSSITEGLSNSICEAMACGIPCVVTDVGDSGFIVGDTGIIVPPGNPKKLADGILDMIRLPPEKRNEMKQMARQRILDKFPVTKMVNEHEKIYESIIQSK